MSAESKIEAAIIKAPTIEGNLLTVALAAWFTANSAYAQNVHSWVSQSTGMRSLGLRPPLLVAVTSAIPEITFSGTFSGTLVGARSGAGAGAGV